jgi:hypothetical protein
MKLLFGQNILILISVIILYYLFNIQTFLPYTPDGSINWQNVIVLIFFTSIILINLVSTIFVLISRIFLRKPLSKELFKKSLKFGIIFTLGILSVFTLNFLHILNIYYGLGIFAIVIILFFII